MYKIEKTSFGFRITFSDFIQKIEMIKWLEESKKVLATTSNSFYVLIDMRQMKLIPTESQEFIQEGQRLYKEKGMVKSAVILTNSLLKMQFERIAKETKIYDYERYINAETDPNWEQTALDWLINGKDPDK